MSSRAVHLFLVAVSVAGFLGSLPVYGYVDIPWPGFMHDYARSSLSQYVGTPTNSTLWYLGARGVTSALVLGDNDTIYFGSHGSLVALGIDGITKFKINVGGTVDPPAIDSDGTIYFENGNTTMFAATPSGAVKWELNSNGTVTIPATDIYNRIYFGNDTALVSLNDDGRLLWNYNTGGLVSMPSVGPDGQIYVGDTDHKFYSIDSQGNLKWKFDTNGTTTAASISPQGTIYFCDSNNTLYALNPEGTLKWSYQSANMGIPPAIGPDGTLFLANGTGIVAINPDGTTKWVFNPAGYTVQSITVDMAGTVYAGTFEDNLFALDSNGSVKWEFKSQGSVGQPVIGPTGTIYFNSGDGSIYALGQAVPEFPLGASLVMTLVIIFGISITRLKLWHRAE